MLRRATWHYGLILVLCGCAGESLEPRDGGDEASIPGDGGSETSVPGDGGACAPVSLDRDLPPGEPVGNPQASGSGECAGRRLVDVIAALHAAYPDLADIATLYDPGNPPMGDGSFIYAWQRMDGGFSLAFVRGWGDCPAGCIDHEYFYFETGTNCAAADLGRYHASYQASGNGYCVIEEGEPRWGKPPSVTPSRLCATDITPQDLGSSAVVYAKGQRVDCDETTKTKPTDIEGCLQLRISQDPGNLGVGTVQLLGTGYPAFDQPLPATFERRRFSVSVDEQGAEGCTPTSRTVEFEFDFETMAGTVSAMDVVPLADCDYCKVNLNLQLTLASEQP